MLDFLICALYLHLTFLLSGHQKTIKSLFAHRKVRKQAICGYYFVMSYYLFDNSQRRIYGLCRIFCLLPACYAYNLVHNHRRRTSFTVQLFQSYSNAFSIPYHNLYPQEARHRNNLSDSRYTACSLSAQLLPQPNHRT